MTLLPTRRMLARTSSVQFSRRLYATKAAKPLRILFCGSDDFSCASLRALHGEHIQHPQSIKSIDVLCRPGKPTGKGLKTIREVPIKAVAQELDLALHERDTFTGWSLPRPNNENINLIVAVSFGLFVPPRILKSAEYGGINVHPSMLPNFRGSAPLQHTILAGEKYTGVTLQTLHPEKFDHGKILAQTPYPGLPIPNASRCTYYDLLEFITPKASTMLVEGIQNRVFDGDVAHDYLEIPQIKGPLKYAPKITPEDRHVDFASMTALDIDRRYRALERLWTLAEIEKGSHKRMVFFGIEVIPRPIELYDGIKSELTIDHEKFRHLRILGRDGEIHSVPVFRDETDYGEGVVIGTMGDESLLVREVTIDGKKKMSAARALFSGNFDDRPRFRDYFFPGIVHVPSTLF